MSKTHLSLPRFIARPEQWWKVKHRSIQALESGMEKLLVVSAHTKALLGVVNNSKKLQGGVNLPTTHSKVTLGEQTPLPTNIVFSLNS